MRYPDFKPPPIAAEPVELVDALDDARLDYVADTLAKAARFCAGASFAAEAHDIESLAVRSREAIIALKEACLVLGELGQAEASP